MRSLVLTFIAAAGMFSAIGQTSAGTSTRTYAFPPVGLGSTETAEVDLANLASNSSTGTAASCTGTITFVNAAGATVKGPVNFTLTAGQSSSTTLAFSASGGTAPRTVIRAIVALTVPTTTPRPPCSLESTLETYDTTGGATHSLLIGSVQNYGGR